MRIGIPRKRGRARRASPSIPAAVGPLVKAGLRWRSKQAAGDGRRLHRRDVSRPGRVAGAAAPSSSRRPTSCCRSARCRRTPALRSGQTVIGFADPLGDPQAIRAVAPTGVNLFSMELMPRITRAQSMDALSSMATIAGYKGVLLAATTLPRMFPMLMTAAGTVSPARVFIVGAGVAGLQAISTARRLGAKSKPTTCGRRSRNRCPFFFLPVAWFVTYCYCGGHVASRKGSTIDCVKILLRSLSGASVESLISLRQSKFYWDRGYGGTNGDVNKFTIEAGGRLCGGEFAGTKLRRNATLMNMLF